MACSVRNGGVCLPPLGALDSDLASSSATPPKTSSLGSYLRLSSRITPKEELLTLLLPTAKLLHLWGDVLSPHEIAEKVKRFFWFYSINRHKSKYFCPKLLGK
jgi:hypothetical protein